MTNLQERSSLSLDHYPVWLDVLFNPLKFEWSVQGLGMMRTYLSETKRLHIWHSAITDYSASPVHDHPWDLESYVLWGRIVQYRFIENDSSTHLIPWYKQALHCGEGGGLIGKPETVHLQRQRVEFYSPKMKYSQKASEIHWSYPDDNTVTIVRRHVPVGRDPDIAHVYWRHGTEWGSAEPRPATRAEILHVTQSVLNEWQRREQ